MSEEKSFMQRVDEWTQSSIIDPIHEAIVDGDGEKCDEVTKTVKRAIREKILDSYKNGLKAKPRGAFQPRSGK